MRYPAPTLVTDGLRHHWVDFRALRRADPIRNQSERHYGTNQNIESWQDSKEIFAQRLVLIQASLNRTCLIVLPAKFFLSSCV